MNDRELKRWLAQLKTPPVNPDAEEQSTDAAIHAFLEQRAESLECPRHEARVTSQPAFSLARVLRDLLWPSPYAWAVLLCIWCGALALQRAAPSTIASPSTASEESPDTIYAKHFYVLLQRDEAYAQLQAFQQTRMTR